MKYVVFSQNIKPALALLMAALMAGCASLEDAPRLRYRCPHGPDFEVRLYQDMAFIDGQRGHAVLLRVMTPEPVASGAPPAAETLRYADPTLDASFGLGLGSRLAALRYTSIPETIHCERVLPDDATAADAPPVRAAVREGPKPPPPPPDPNAPVQTNIIRGDGNNGPG